MSFYLSLVKTKNAQGQLVLGGRRTQEEKPPSMENCSTWGSDLVQMSDFEFKITVKLVQNLQFRI